MKTLHRVDEELVLREILAAGFELEVASDLLRYSKDTRDVNVFRRAIKGRTDRFVLAFRKSRPMPGVSP